MKIAVVSTPVFALGSSGAGGYSGLEHIAWLCAKGLAAKGHQVALVAPDGSACPGAAVVPCGPAGRVNEKLAFAAYADALAEVDVVIDHSWMKFAYQLRAAGKLRAPVLGVMHAPINTMYQVWPPAFPGLPPVENACPVCISEDQRRHFEAFHGRQARTCRNGIDPDFYRPMEVPRTDRFLFLARFSTVKSPDLALEACFRAGVGLDLVGDTSITGEPDFFRHCQALAARTSPGWDPAKGPQFRVFPGCPRGETVWWYGRAHVMLHPNQRFREPLGLAPLEAMACGCPVLCWDYGAMKETVPSGSDHWFNNYVPGQRVASLESLVEWVRIYAQPASVTPRGRAAVREHARQFSVDVMVNRYEELCAEAVNTGGW